MEQDNPLLPDATDFTDLTLKSQPEYRPGLKSICPVCKGYGYWNLRLNAYGPGKHFQAICSQCLGWGWVSDEDKNCIHEMKHTKNLGRCYNEYTCTKCGKKKDVDSSD